MPGEFSVQFKMPGAKALEQLLLALGPVPAGRVGQKAVRAGAEIFVTKMKQNVAARGLLLTHRMYESIKAQNGSEQEKVRTAFAGSQVFYAKFSEFGTAHQAATPWARPAVDEGASDALAAMAATLGTEIAKEVGRLINKHGLNRKV